MAEVDIIVVEYKTPEKTIAAVKSLLSYTPGNVQIAVVDNSVDERSTEKIVSALKSFNNVYVFPSRENLGYGRGCNLGAALIPNKSPYLIFSNSDIEATPGYWEPLKKGLEQPKVYAVGPKLVSMDGKKLVGAGVIGTDWDRKIRGWLEPAERYSQTEEVVSLCGAFFACHRNIFEELGGFDERFLHYFEETSNIIDARLKGYHVWYCGSSVIRHEVHGSCKDSIKLQKLFQQSKKIFDEKYKDILKSTTPG